MYRRPVESQAHRPPTDSQLGTSLLQSVSNRARVSAATSTSHSSETSSITAPMHVITNSASFDSFLRSHRVAVAFFTSRTCPPCRMIEPVFERLSEQKSPQGVACAKIDIHVGLGRSLAGQWNIRATPTFYFFLDGEKVSFFSRTNVILVVMSCRKLSSRGRMQLS